MIFLKYFTLRYCFISLCIRNKKIENNPSNLVSDYRTIVEQLKRLILIIGDKKIKECYFYNPDSLKILLNNYGMNYDEIELAFTRLCGCDYDVYAIGHNKKLQNSTNYKLHKYAEMLLKITQRQLAKYKH